MALDLGGAKNKKKKSAGEHRIIQLDLFKPTKKKYPVFDFEEIRKEQLGEKDDSGDERFHDSDALELVRRLEAKYGGKSKKKKRRIIGTEDDFIDKCAGYELDDPFIDDSEAYDELIPSNWDTAEGGFYVNKGKLEFKEKFEMADLSDLSEDEAPVKPTRKRSRPPSDEEMEVEEEAVTRKKTESEPKKPAPVAPAPVPGAQSRPSMMGAPPSKKYAPSSNQLAAKAIIKKRLSGVPSTLSKPRLIKTNLSASMTNLSTATNAAAPSQNGTGSGSETPSTSTVPSPSKAPVKAVETASSSMQGTSPMKPRKPLPAMSQTLTDMIENFKKITGNLALPGQKKRLQNQHIDMLISFEDQYIKDGLTVHERARVFHSIADYVGIQRNSLYARVNKRKEDLKGGATPELPSTIPSPTVTVSKPQESSKNDEVTVIGATKSKELTPTINGAENLRNDAVHIEDVRKALDALKKSGLDKESQLLLANYTTYNEFSKSVKKLVDAKQQQKEAEAAALKYTNGSAVDPSKNKANQAKSQTTPAGSAVAQLSACKTKFDKLADEVVKERAKITEQAANMITLYKFPKTFSLYAQWPSRFRERFRALFKEFTAAYLACVPGTVNVKNVIDYANAVISKDKFGNLITQAWVLLEIYIADKEKFADILKSDTLRDSVKGEGTSAQNLLEKMDPKKAPTASSGADDEIQFLDEHGNIPSTSTPKSVGGASSTVTSGAKSTPITSSRPAVSNSQAVNAAATLAALQMGLATNNPQNMAALQAMLDPQLMKALQGSSQMQSQMMQMQFLQQAQQAALTAAKEQEKKKLEEKRLAEERKQKEKEEKIRLIQQKKAEALAEKQRQIEEKKKKIEEEKRKKAEEKAKREEEERLRRQREQLEREKRIEEERERQQREELERKRREEDERQRQMTLRIKQEEEMRRQREEQRLAQLLQEEQLAAALLEDEAGFEAGEDQEAVFQARQEAIEEEERVRRQEEQALAARKSTVSQMEQKPIMHNGSQESHHANIKMEPQVHDLNQQNGFHQPTFFQQQAQSNGQNFQQTVSQNTVPQSPQFMTGSPYTGPGSNGTVIGQSPLNQQMGQSPYQMNQSPMNHHIPQSPVKTRPPVQPQYTQQTNFAGNGFNGMQQQQNQTQYMAQQRMMAQDQMQMQMRQMEHQRQLEQQRLVEQRQLEQQRQQQEQQRMIEQQRQLEQQRLLEEQQRQQRMLEEQNAQQQQMLQQQRQQQMLQQQRLMMQQQQQGHQQQMQQNNGYFPGNQNNFQGYM